MVHRTLRHDPEGDAAVQEGDDVDADTDGEADADGADVAVAGPTAPAACGDGGERPANAAGDAEADEHAADEHAAFEGLLDKDAETAALLSQYRSTIATPDRAIKFPDKASLRKSVPLVAVFSKRTAYAAAAVIIILLGISSLFMFDRSADAFREDLRIVKLTTQENEFLATASKPTFLNMREVEEVMWRNDLREEIVLTRLPSVELAGSIPVQAYQMNMGMEIRYVNPNFIDLSNETEALADASESKTATGRIISGFFEKLQKPFRSDKTGSSEPNNKGFSFWDIAEYGVKGINALGDHEYTLVRQYNEKGNVKGVMLLEE